LGMQIDAHVREAILAQPEHAWTPAVEPDGQVRDGAVVCELTGWVDLGTWPDGTRVLCRREDAHPGAQLRFTDHDGHRFQVLSPTNPTMTWPGWSCDTASAPGSRTASAPPRPPAWPTCRLTAGAATPSGWSWSWPPRISAAGPRRCCWTAPGRGRAQDAALPAAPCRRPDRSSRPPPHPAAAGLLAVGGRARRCVRSTAGPAAALLTRPAPPTVCPIPTGSGQAARQPSQVSPQLERQPSSRLTPPSTPPTPPDSRPGDHHHAP
jgi:hypothetical protein